VIRRNLISLVGACGALAVGIALGAGPLSDVGHAESERAGDAGEVSGDLSRRVAVDERFVTDIGKAVVAGRLAKQRIAILAFPGVQQDVIAGVSAQVRTGGGAVTSVVRIAPAMVDPGRRTYLDTLSKRLAPRLDGRVNTTLDAYPRFGQLLGATYAGKKAATSFDAGQSTAAETLRTAKLVTVSGGKTPATLVLVLVAKPVDRTVLTGIVHGLGGAAHAVVSAGPSSSTDLAALRAQDWGTWFASVDGVDTPAGQVATALALAHQVSQGGGDYGASGFGGLVPLG